MIWDSVIAAASGLGGAFVGAYVTRKSETERRLDETQREQVRLDRQDAADQVLLRAAARLMLDRVALAGSMMNTASEDDVWAMGQLPGPLPIEERRILARMNSYDDFTVLLAADVAIDTVAFVLDTAARVSGRQQATLTDSLREMLAKQVEELEPALGLLRRLSGAPT
jgi:hypothetical protein